MVVTNENESPASLGEENATQIETLAHKDQEPLQELEMDDNNQADVQVTQGMTELQDVNNPTLEENSFFILKIYVEKSYLWIHHRQNNLTLWR